MSDETPPPLLAPLLPNPREAAHPHLLRLSGGVCTMRCPHGIWIGACSACKPIHTSRDQAWHFRHPVLGYIDSKGEFDRRCKRKGWVRVSTDEVLTRGEPTTRALPSRQEITKRIEGVIRDVKAQAQSPERVEQKWREVQDRVAHPVSPVGVDYADLDPIRKEG